MNEYFRDSSGSAQIIWNTTTILRYPTVFQCLVKLLSRQYKSFFGTPLLVSVLIPFSRFATALISCSMVGLSSYGSRSCIVACHPRLNPPWVICYFPLATYHRLLSCPCILSSLVAPLALISSSLIFFSKPSRLAINPPRCSSSCAIFSAGVASRCFSTF